MKDKRIVPMRIRSYALTLTLLLIAAAAVYPIDTSRTAMIGGVDLFDTESPLVGIQNPALLNDYGRINPTGAVVTNTRTAQATNIQALTIPVTNTVSITNKNKKNPISVRVTNLIVMSNIVATNVYVTNLLTIKEAPVQHHIGRLFLLNPYFSFGASEDLLTSFQYYIGMFKGQLGDMPQSQAEIMRQTFLILSFGLIDIQPLFSQERATTYEIVSNLIQASQSRSGFYFGMNMNVLSFNRDGFGIAAIMETEVYGGTVGNKRDILFMINDPIFSMQFRYGAALSISPGTFDLPLLGNTAVGYTVRVYPMMMETRVESAADYFDLYDQFKTYSSNGMDYTAFGDGRLVKVGMGLSGDIAIMKNVTSDFQVTFKLYDILSPRYWLNSKEFGWVLPDLSFGLKYTFPIDGVLKYFVNKPSLYFQMDDLFYTHPKTLLAKVRMGADVLLLLDLFQLGVGLNAGYPTVGLSFHLPLFFVHLKVYASLYGKELGYYPGDFGFQGYSIGTEFYLGF